MPIVVVHGVANRTSSPGYAPAVALRDALFRQFAYPVIGIPQSTPVISPYWGGSAATFRWNNASYPSEPLERFGGDDLADEILLSYLDKDIDDETRILARLARESTEDAVDLLLAFASQDLNGDPDEAAELAALVARVSCFTDDRAVTESLALARDDDEVLDRLLRAMADDSATTESFGGKSAVYRLSEGLSRLRRSGSRMTGRSTVALTRRPLHSRLSVFLGDVLTYLARRGTRDAPGPIPRVIADAIVEASQVGSPGEPLVVIGHSLGGVISLDVLSHFRPDLAVDALVTVGSQVGLFAELSLLAEQQASHPVLPGAAEKVGESPAPLSLLPQVRRWINVVDLNDLLGFAAEGVFTGVRDFRYSTGRGMFMAHSAYLSLPSFHRRFANRWTAAT